MNANLLIIFIIAQFLYSFFFCIEFIILISSYSFIVIECKLLNIIKFIFININFFYILTEIIFYSFDSWSENIFFPHSELLIEFPHFTILTKAIGCRSFQQHWELSNWPMCKKQRQYSIRYLCVPLYCFHPRDGFDVHIQYIYKTRKARRFRALTCADCCSISVYFSRVDCSS